MRRLISKTNNMIIAAKIKAGMMVNDLVTKKKDGDSHFVAVAVMLLIVLVVGIAFNTQIGTFMSNIFTKITNKANTIL